MREFFDIDLLDLWRGRLSFPEISAYIKSLLTKQGRSALLMALDETAVWPHEAHILARVSDALELSNFLFLKANANEEEIGPIPTPLPLPRPGIEPTPPQTPASPEEFATGQEVTDFFAHMNSM